MLWYKKRTNLNLSSSSCFSQASPVVFATLSIAEPVWVELFLENRWESPAGTHGQQRGEWSTHVVTSWWRQQMETFSALLAICARNSPVIGEFHSQRPVTRSFEVFFDLRLNKGWVNNRVAIDLRHCRARYDVTVMRGLLHSAWWAPQIVFVRFMISLKIHHWFLKRRFLGWQI